MKSTTQIQVGLDDYGNSRVLSSYCEAPLLVREIRDEFGLTLMVVNNAAGPVGGDDITLEISFAERVTARVRSVAATLVMPGAIPAPSQLTTRISLANESKVDWELEPMVSVQNSRHLSLTSVTAHQTAELQLSETLLLGRSNEPSGVIDLRQSVERDDVLLLDQTLGAGSDEMRSHGAQGNFRWLWSQLILGSKAHIVNAANVNDLGVDTTFVLDEHASLQVVTGHSNSPWRGK